MESQSTIQWRYVRGYEGYYWISSDGRVYGEVRGQEKKPVLHHSGFWGINLLKNGETAYFLIHRLMADAFLDAQKGARVRHKDGDKSNNTLSNLLVIPRKEKPIRIRKGFAGRFWDNVKVAGDDECWLWTGRPNGAGYGSMVLNGKTVMAHRASWLIHFGEIEEASARIVVMHKCDNRLCVNPHHLELGTHKDNTQDAMKKGRLRPFGHTLKQPAPVGNDEQRQCNTCGESRSIGDFYFNGLPRKDGSRYRMRVCRFCFNKKHTSALKRTSFQDSLFSVSELT